MEEVCEDTVSQSHRFLKFGEFFLDVEQSLVYKIGPSPRVPITLTSSAVDVLRVLATHSANQQPDVFLSRAKISHLANVSYTSVGNHIGALRKALGKDTILNLSRFGYRIDPPAFWYEDEGFRARAAPQPEVREVSTSTLTNDQWAEKTYYRYRVVVKFEVLQRSGRW